MEIPLANDDAWNTAEGTAQGKPSILRYRPNLKNYLGDPAYPKRLTITWTFDPGNASGMPSSEQVDEMGVFEETVVDSLDPDRCAVLAFVRTNNGTREWHFYVRSTQEVGAKLNKALSGFPRPPIQLTAEDDNEWSELQRVFRMCGEVYAK